MRLLNILAHRWSRDGGYSRTLKLGIPLIFASNAFPLLQLIDRLFLTWYSPEATAAAVPASVISFMMITPFGGTAGYVAIFVAQYFGAGQNDRIGAILWQGFYVGVIAMFFHLLLIPLAGPLFSLLGHGEAVVRLEAQYFQMLCLAAGPQVAAFALSGFYMGRGRPILILLVNVISLSLNVILDWVLIFGHLGLPAMGMRGAGLATLASCSFTLAAYLWLLTRPVFRRVFKTTAHMGFNPQLFLRLVRFGLPSGMQFFVENIGYTIFLLIIGQLGTQLLAASNTVYNIINLMLIPVWGIGNAVSMMVGQSVGRLRPDIAERYIYSGIQIVIFTSSLFLALFLVWPPSFLSFFRPLAGIFTYQTMYLAALICLVNALIYSLQALLTFGIKGAGDSHFVMWVVFICSMLILDLPIWIAVNIFHLGLFTIWGVSILYASTLALTFAIRFYRGKWKTMQVIEEAQKAAIPVT